MSDNEVPIVIVPLTEEELADREQLRIESNKIAFDFVESKRKSQYQQIADPLFMKYQRGEATKEEWLAAIEAIKEANPYPTQETP